MITLNTFYIDGAWVAPASSETMPIRSPATNRQIQIQSMRENESARQRHTS